MGINAGDLYMTLALNAGDFNAALAGAQQSVNEASDKIQANWMKIGLGVTAMGTAIEAAFTVAIEEFVNAGVAIDVLSEKTGISTEAVSQWRYIAEQSGVSADSLTLAWRTMAKDITDVSGASSSAQKAFADLGLSLSDLQAMKPEDQFNTIATALAGVADKSVQSADAQAIFGRSGTDLLPILANGAAGIANLKDQATQLGIVYSGPAAAAALSFMDSQNNLKDSVKGVWDAIAQDLMPTIQPLIDDVTHAVEAVTHWTDTHKALSSAIEIAVASIGVALIAVGTIITTMAAAAVAFEIGTVAAFTFGVTLSAAIWPVTLVVAAIAALVAGTILVVDHWNEWRGVIEEVGSDIAVVLLVPIDLFIYALGGILDGIGKVASALHMSWGTEVQNAGKDLLDLNGNILAWGKAQDDATNSVQSTSENLKQENDYLSDNGRNLAVTTAATKESTAANDAYTAAVKAATDEVQKLSDSYTTSQTAGGKLGITVDDITNYLLKQGESVQQIDTYYQSFGYDQNAILNSTKVNLQDVAAGMNEYQQAAKASADATAASLKQIQSLSDAYTLSQTTGAKMGLTLTDITNYLVKQGATVQQIQSIYDTYGNDTDAILNSTTINFKAIKDSMATVVDESAILLAAEQAADAQIATGNSSLLAANIARSAETLATQAQTEKMTALMEVDRAANEVLIAQNEIDTRSVPYLQAVADMKQALTDRTQALADTTKAQTDATMAATNANLNEATSLAAITAAEAAANAALTATNAKKQADIELTTSENEITIAQNEALDINFSKAQAAADMVQALADNQKALKDQATAATLAVQAQTAADFENAGSMTAVATSKDTAIGSTTNLTIATTSLTQALANVGGSASSASNAMANVGNAAASSVSGVYALTTAEYALAAAENAAASANNAPYAGMASTPVGLSSGTSIGVLSAADKAAAAASLISAGGGYDSYVPVVPSYDTGGVGSYTGEYAEGGIVTKKTRAIVGEAGEPEAIIPLSKRAQYGFGGDGGGIVNNITFPGAIVRSDQDIQDIADRIVNSLRLRTGLKV